MFNKSPYNHRYLFAGIYIVVLVLACVYILLNAFVIQRVEKALMPSASLTFTPVPETPHTTPVETVYTDSQYTDENIRISITTVEETDLVYYVADIRLNSLQYFKTAFANGDYGRNLHETTSSQARNNDAILAINGDYYGFDYTGLVIRNGTLYRDKPEGESIVLMMDGNMRIVDDTVSGTSLIEQGALHSWSFGPTLVMDGHYVERESNVSVANPRTGIGMIEPYHYVFIVVDGRGVNGSKGLSMKDFAQVFVDLGCTVAYNLDGGGTSTMVMNDKIVNSPCYGDERGISDIIYIGLD